MQDIADKLELSVATVSRSLRRVPGINPETRALVLQTASELGYRASKTYQNTPLEKDKLKHIGIFIETPHSHLPPAYMTGLIDASMSLNASPVIHYVKPGECESILDPAHQPAAMRSGLLSGAILIFWWPTDVVKKLSKKMPIVSIMHKYPGTGIDMIGIDNEEGMALLVEQLYNQGHRKIGFFGRCKQLHWANVRFGGYVAALTAHGLKFNAKHVIDTSFEDAINFESDWSQYTPQAEKLTKQGVTAWICVSEPAGWNLNQYLTKQGLRVPQDVSITGFHRPTPPEPNQPDMTSVSASHEAIGAAAMRRLLHRIQNPAETSRAILFPCEPYQGQTTGPAQ